MTGRGRPYIGRTIEIRLPDDEIAKLKARAKLEQIPVAALVREVIRRYLLTT